MYYYLYNLSVILSTVIVGGEPAPTPAVSAEVGAEAPGGFFGFLGGGGGTSMILMWAVLFGGMYLLMIRPQRKREKAMREMQAALQVGDSVVTSSGFFGNIVSIGEDCFIVEFGTSKGVRIPVRKTDVIGKQSPNTIINTKE